MMTRVNNFQEVDFSVAGKSMYDLAQCLYPICRSITGDGVRETLSILKEFIPLQVREIPTGTKVFDWEIPDEWNIRDAWIKDPNGNKIVDFKKLNLHVLNYSIPVDQKVSLEELKEHVYTIPENPDWVPYRTSYYSRKWGFCMSHKQFTELQEGDSHVHIDSDLKPGSLTYGEYFIQGETDDEVLFSCHVCHPSLCNDNLSGITIATWIAGILKDIKTRYSYRFLFIPGTIGSIAWLSENEDKVKNIKHGLVLSLLGDSTAFSYKKSRRGDTEIDKIMEYILKDEKEAQILEFSPYGYDERQYCSPGFNLAVGRLTRKPFGEFPEYHTSADNLDFIDAEYLGESLKLLSKVVLIIEGNEKYINLSPKGEPQLGKRGLYNTVGGNSHQKDYQMALLWTLNMSDGQNSVLDIAVKSGIEFETIHFCASELIRTGLLKEKKSQTN
jgi:aminopeptidase-like protein